MQRLVALVVLMGSFCVTLLIARVGRVVWRIRCGDSGRILVTGRFDNLNWFLSHVTPLSRSGVREVLVVSESAIGNVTRVRFLCPPQWAIRIMGRSLSKLLWMIAAAVRYRADVVMGYHLFPGALTALIAARVIGRSACYQMTGGPIEILGGGYLAENKLMKSLSRPSALLERLAVAVVREFELVVVRGNGAKRALAKWGIGDSVAIITGSVDMPAVTDEVERRYDIVFVGRLTEIKQPAQFVSIVATLGQTLPNVCAICVGNGPELESLQRQAEALGVTGNIKFAGQSDHVSTVLRQSKVFVLTSRSEGMSIAMAEAMSFGLPVVAANVGDLGDLVKSGVNGWLVQPNDIDGYARRVLELLANDETWSLFSRAARESVMQLSVDEVASRWRYEFERLHTGQR